MRDEKRCGDALGADGTVASMKALTHHSESTVFSHLQIQFSVNDR